jgi:hypothetical protein
LPGPGAKATRLIIFVTTTANTQAQCFMASVTFVSKIGAYSSGAPKGASCLGSAPSLSHLPRANVVKRFAAVFTNISDKLECLFRAGLYSQV